jgi:hypothetical protein
MEQYISYFLRCECGSAIPLPHPSLQEVIAFQTGASREIRTAVFVCTECGIVSAYSSEDVRTHPSPIPDLYQREERTLGYIEMQCAETNCAAQKRLYLLGTGPKTIGEGTMKVRPKDWRFSPSAICTRGHALRFSEDELYRWYQTSDSPL